MALRRRLSRVEPLLAFYFGVYFLLVLALAPHELVADSWLALVSGREVVEHGLPSHDQLVVLAHGRPWIDQQWLAQALYYALWQLGGVALALLLSAVAATGGVAIAAANARLRGASARSIILVAAPCVFVAPSALQLRTQTLAFPLFSALLLLLGRESARPTRRIVFVLPILILWANLHGSVVVGLGLVALYALTIVRRRPGRAAAIAVGAVASAFASPYALRLLPYYHATLGSRTLATYSAEWRPSTWSNAKPLFVVIALAALLIARDPRTLRTFDKLAFLAIVVLALAGVRNLVWIALAIPALVPPSLDSLWSSKPSATPVRLPALTATVLAVVAVGVAVFLTRPASWFERSWPDHVAAETARAVAHRPGARVFASDDYSDWLLWKEPRLRGRVAYDARFELLTARQLRALAKDRAAVAARFQVQLLSRSEDGGVQHALRGGRTILFSDDSAEVLAAPAR